MPPSSFNSRSWTRRSSWAPHLVTADGVATLGPLDYNSVSVGQHITVRGIATIDASGAALIDATGATQTNTGSVRLQSTQLFGSMISSAAGSLLLNLQAIQNWPISVYNFAGNGTSTAQDPLPGNYLINTGALTLPAAAARRSALDRRVRSSVRERAAGFPCAGCQRRVRRARSWKSIDQSGYRRAFRDLDRTAA